MPCRLLLDTATNVIKGVSVELDDVKGSHDFDNIGKFLGGSCFDPVEYVRPDDFDAIAPALGAGIQPLLEDLFRLAGHHVEQPCCARCLVDRGEVGDDTVTYLSPRRIWRHTCSSTPMTETLSKRVGSLMSTRWPSARTAECAVCQDSASFAAMIDRVS